MKTAIGFLLCIVIFCFLPTLLSNAQEKPAAPDMTLRRIAMPSVPQQPRSERSPRFRIPGKKVSQYTAEDWGAWIDSTWGTGQGGTEQLKIFDSFWTTIDQKWAGFPNLPLDWDSLRTLYRPQIGSGLSRGRFSSLMSRLWFSLLEHHTWIADEVIENSYSPSSGFPLFCVGTGWESYIGGSVTALSDSSCLVYRVEPGNPLGLEPGDLVLGYEGVPWKRLCRQLLDNGVPISRYWSNAGSTPEGRLHFLLSGVQWNWGMFDTIDIVKYSTGDTVHLPTAPLAGFSPTMPASDQVPVTGVPMPIGFGNKSVSWGIVQGTNVGYIYAWDWSSPNTDQFFYSAVEDLCHHRKVEGLIIDYRMNWGGQFGSGVTPPTGLSLLFGFNPVLKLQVATRTNAGDHMGFSFSGSPWIVAPTATFDRPIAVLIGPACLSSGDYNAFFLRFHPMARSFGRPTNGAFVYDQTEWTPSANWYSAYPVKVLFSDVPGQGYLIHKGVQPDEEVWLTRDGVAKGEDAVVKRAIEWITTLTYAHDVSLDRSYARPHLDSVTFTVRLANPLGHTAALSAIVTDSGKVVRDSLILFNDGFHGDGGAVDSVWGCRLSAPSSEGFFDVSVRTEDITVGTSRRLPNACRFTTAGPLTLDSVAYMKIGLLYRVRLYLRNKSSSATIGDAMVTLRCNDPWVKDVTQSPYALPTIGPGEIKSPALVYSITPDDTVPFPGYFNLKVDVAIGGLTFWVDSTRLRVTGIGQEQELPVAYALEQNFPNPFNPSTNIRYELSKASMVRLSVYDILGREVSVLVNEKKDAGAYEAQFDAAGLASGVYLYRLRADGFLSTKKMLVLR